LISLLYQKRAQKSREQRLLSSDMREKSGTHVPDFVYSLNAKSQSLNCGLAFNLS